MDDLDLKIVALLSTLAAIVNRSMPTNDEAVKMSKVPRDLLRVAKQQLVVWGASEYTTDAVCQASRRILS